MASSYDPADDFDGIVAAFFAHLARRQEPSFDFVKIPENGFLFPPDAPTLWVKFDVDVSSMVSESEMQTYVYHHLPPQENCCIPKVHRVYVSNPDFASKCRFQPPVLLFANANAATARQDEWRFLWGALGRRSMGSYCHGLRQGDEVTRYNHGQTRSMFPGDSCVEDSKDTCRLVDGEGTARIKTGTYGRSNNVMPCMGTIRVRSSRKF